MFFFFFFSSYWQNIRSNGREKKLKSLRGNTRNIRTSTKEACIDPINIAALFENNSHDKVKNN